ncbi:MAG: hypothetical protein HN820_02690, partial [Candidatus Marinimicrobia bacterium]|nr:hypothetical protein [Candidatus Neomarinimicrobiota bacterium]
NVSDETEFNYIRVSGAEKEYGGGMYLNNSNPKINNVTINGNKGIGGGLGMNNSNPTIKNVIIKGNTGSGSGGGIYLNFSNPIITNTTIIGNVASRGGGIILYDSDPILNHVTIVDNVASGSTNPGGGIYLRATSNFTLTNSIIWNNTPGPVSFENITNQPNINFSDVDGIENDGFGCLPNNDECGSLIESECYENVGYCLDTYNDWCVDFDESTCQSLTDIGECGGWSIGVCIGWVENNLIDNTSTIDADPLFADPENGDYTLQEGSPCIDAGTSDIDGDGIDDITDFVGSAPDMGAYEFGESSEIMTGDTNFDGIVDILDIVRIVNQIMGNSDFNDDEFTAADFNDDGIVDILDIVQIVNYILQF